MRKPFDLYPTPASVVNAMIDRFMFYRGSRFAPDIVWEPCSGDGRIAAALRGRGVTTVIETDIMAGQNFFEFDTALAPIIITNPPFRHIRPFIDHAFKIGIQQMALVCGERLWACKKGREQYGRRRPTVFAMMDWREDYLGKGGKPDRALAVSMWMTPKESHCKYEIWTKDVEFKRCLECSNLIDVQRGTSRPDRRYCTDACRMRAYRKRKSNDQQNQPNV